MLDYAHTLQGSRYIYFLLKGSTQENTQIKALI